MTSKDAYIRETGDSESDDQIGYHSWYRRYVRWMERFVEKHYTS